MGNLNLPESNEAGLYKALCNRLRNHGTLKRVIKGWSLYDGETCTAVNSNKTPFLSLQPGSKGGSVQTEIATDAIMSLTLTYYVDGSDAADAFNLWDAIRKVLFPGDGTMQALLQQYKAYAMSIDDPGYTVEEADGKVLVGQAVINIKFRVASRL